MFLFDPETLRFLDVNDAAIKNYGYSRKEFMNITVKDIRPVDDMELFDKVLNENKKKNHFTHLGIYRHQKKNGEMIQVDLLTNVIKYKGKDAKIVVANDVTQRSKYIKAIEDQNQKLREISWIQSHIVRAPLSRILGLIPLINDAKEDSEDRDAMLKYLASSANDLDDVIKSITEKTSKADYDMRLDS